jgi:hypothetical protein
MSFDKCGICFEEKSREVCILSCSHSFHTTCIENWFKTGAITCPFCRSHVRKHGIMYYLRKIPGLILGLLYIVWSMSMTIVILIWICFEHYMIILFLIPSFIIVHTKVYNLKTLLICSLFVLLTINTVIFISTFLMGFIGIFLKFYKYLI